MSVNDRVGAHHERMRSQGHRLAQTRVPDVRSERFAIQRFAIQRFTIQAHEQSITVAQAGRKPDDQALIEAVSATWEE